MGRGEKCGAARDFRRGGLTLVEMLIALACVVLLMLAYTQLFSSVSGRISDARSMIELEHRMRSATQELHGDLASLTCDMLPWQNPSNGAGYFEYIEGPLSDQRPGYTDNIYPGVQQFLGDTDDVLMFTVRSKRRAVYWPVHANAWRPDGFGAITRSRGGVVFASDEVA